MHDLKEGTKTKFNNQTFRPRVMLSRNAMFTEPQSPENPATKNYFLTTTF